MMVFVSSLSLFPQLIHIYYLQATQHEINEKQTLSKYIYDTMGIINIHHVTKRCSKNEVKIIINC